MVELPMQLKNYIIYVKELNINNNPFKDINQVINALKNLPNLISLYMSLYEEDTVHAVITQLTQLQFLNGIEISRKEVLNTQFSNDQCITQPNEEDEQLKQNQCDSPTTQSNRRHTSSHKVIKEEDLPLELIKETDEDDNQSFTQNQPHNLTRDQDIAVVGATRLSDITGAQSNISSFKNSPVKSAKNNFQKPLQLNTSSAQSSQSQINGEAKMNQGLNSKDSQVQNKQPQDLFSTSDLEKISQYFENIGGFIIRAGYDTNNQTRMDFNRQMEQLVNQLKEFSVKQIPEQYKQAQYLQAKSTLIELCLKKLHQYLLLTGNPIQGIFQGLLGQSTLLVQQLFYLINQSELKRQQQVEGLSQDLQNLKYYINEEKEQLDTKLANLVAENERLKQIMNINTIHSFHDTIIPREINSSMSSNGLRSPNFNQKQINISFINTPQSIDQVSVSNFQSPPNEILGGSKKMSAQGYSNKKMHIKNKSFDFTKQFTVMKNYSTAQNKLTPQIPSGFASPKSTFHRKQQSYEKQLYEASDINLHTKKKITKLNESIVSKQNEPKALGIRQTKEIITEVFNTKIVYDQKCRELQMPIETMEQYLYTFLSKKYGLKDADVGLFAKCLKNECDQEFRQVQDFVKDQISYALKQVVRDKYNQKAESEINNILDNVKQNTNSMDKWMWQKTLAKLYSSEEKDKLEQKINELIQQQVLKESTSAKKQTASSRKSLNTSTLNGKRFTDIVLETQLKQHELYLKPFNELFKDIDSDNNGILSHEEFKKLCQIMEIRNRSTHSCNILNDKSVLQLIKTIDPCGHKQMTYGQILYALANVKYIFSIIISLIQLRKLCQYRICNPQVMMSAASKAILILRQTCYRYICSSSRINKTLVPL
ncbi:UNKNOWN [Stylonychia lemnae]|uniref:EF-hand domain-containing protein n=1 Tax=Stylonychia lemnae TaxID=5949 RepID=A0A078ANY4_STYLE|nr:UNKNOWN [Stylonychia lemnae]|eukprot:CDW83017.1 UNKNOWN [Stylonychia lemnae]